MTPLIFQKLRIQCDSLKHAHAHSTQGLVSPKELARAEEGPAGLCQLKEQRHSSNQFLTAKGTQYAFIASNSLWDSRAVSRYL